VDAKYSNWKMEHLPIVPETWNMKPNAKTKKQLTVVKGLLKKSNHVVIATIASVGVCTLPTDNTPRYPFFCAIKLSARVALMPIDEQIINIIP
jgi:hypothetical protein